MKILITGGAGFIGSTLAKYFLEQGHTVTILDDFSSGSPHAIRECFAFDSHFYCLQGSVLDRNLVFDIMSGIQFVFHLAAKVHIEESIVEPEIAFSTNSIGTQNILEAARRHRTQYILYASSTEVYGEAKTDPIKESHTIAPRSPYAAGKAAADAICAAYYATYSSPVIVLRQFNTYGPGQRFKGYSAVIPIFADRLFKGRPPIIYGDGQQSRDFHYISDLMRAYELVMQAPDKLVGKTINLGTGVATTINELAMTMIEVAAKAWHKPELKNMQPVHIAPRPGEVPRFCADISIAKELMGFEPCVTLAEGLEKYLTWFAREFS